MGRDICLDSGETVGSKGSYTLQIQARYKNLDLNTAGITPPLSFNGTFVMVMAYDGYLEIMPNQARINLGNAYTPEQVSALKMEAPQLAHSDF